MELPTILQRGYLKFPDDPNAIPIDYIAETIQKMKESVKVADKVVIIIATTGSGKSTIIAPMLYKKFLTKSDKLIAVTEPRILSAVTLPSAITPYDTSLVLGKNIGYKTGNARVNITSGILFLTIGSLLAQFSVMSDEDICDKFAVIIIDEAHESNIQTDIMHLTLKIFLRKNHTKPNCPIVIITSATIDPEKFMAYYFNTRNCILVQGTTHKITEHFLPITSKDVIKSTIDTVLQICKLKADDKSDILIFFSGKQEMLQFKNRIENLIDSTTLLTIDSDAIQSFSKEYENAFKPISKLNVNRKIILSTNASETGVTFPYARYMIDTGFYKSNEYNPEGCFTSLIRKPIARFSHIQRRGRVGRRFPGDCYYMYTEDILDEMEITDHPEIYKADISILVLQIIDAVKVKSIIDITEVDFVHRPSISSVWRAVEKLYILGFITSGFTLTKMGELVSHIPKLSVEQIKIILSGYVWKASIEDLIIAALAMEFKKPKNIRTPFAMSVCCDYLVIVEQWYLARALNFDYKALISANIQADMINKINKQRDEIILALARIGLNPYANNSKTLDKSNNYFEYAKTMKRCLYEGLKLNLAKWDGTKYLTRTGLVIDKIFSFTVSEFIYSEIRITFDIYRRKVDPKMISVLDGFITSDNSPLS